MLFWLLLWHPHRIFCLSADARIPFNFYFFPPTGQPVCTRTFFCVCIHSNLCSFVCFVFFSCFSVHCPCYAHVKNAPAKCSIVMNIQDGAKSDSNKNNNSSRTFRMCLCVTWVNFNWIILIWLKTKRYNQATDKERKKQPQQQRQQSLSVSLRFSLCSRA